MLRWYHISEDRIKVHGHMLRRHTDVTRPQHANVVHLDRACSVVSLQHANIM